MLYPLAIQAGDRNTAFGVIVPDLPGCFSAGDSYRGLKSNGTKTYAKQKMDKIGIFGLIHNP